MRCHRRGPANPLLFFFFFFLLGWGNSENVGVANDAKKDLCEAFELQRNAGAEQSPSFFFAGRVLLPCEPSLQETSVGTRCRGGFNFL